MKRAKKVLAIIFTISILLGMVVLPTDAFTASTLAMPEGFVAIDDFNGENTLGWQSTNKATLEFSDAHGYGTEGKSAHVSWSASGWSGFKTSSSANISLKGNGFAFWAYNAGSELTNFAVVLLQNGVKYEKKITLNAGEGVYQIPWTDFIIQNGTTPIDVSITVSQIDFTKSSGSANYYIDQIGCYGVPPLTMPEGFVAIDDFNGENILGWESHGSTLEFSDAYGYGTEGKSAHVSWSASGWNGFKTSSSANISLKGDGFAFWAYNAGSELTNFAVVLLQNSVKYEKKITLNAGEGVYQIPWTEFVNNEISVDVTQTVSQIDFTKSATSADYYIDQIGCYGVPKNSVTMPDGFVAIEEFEQGNTRGWSGTSDANIELTTDYGFGEESTSVHVYTDSSTSTYKGFKTTITQNITCKGEGVVFWAYNAKEANSKFYVKLRNSDGAFEKMITLNADEGLYQIPWSDFKTGDNSIDTTKAITQIEFTAVATTLDYYVDNIGFYNVPKNAVTMPEKGFMLIDDFEDTDPLAWTNKSNATFELTDDYGYGEASQSGHVTITASGYNGMQSGTVNIVPKGDGVTFWAYNPSSVLSKFYVVLTQNSVKYEASITLEQNEKYYEIAWDNFGKQNETTTKFNVDNGAITKIEMYANASAGEFYIDQLGFFGVQPHTLEMPYGFAAIENFDSGSTSWKNQGNAALEYSTTLGYNTSAHITWSTGGWSGINSGSSNANISLKGDGFTFWVYNDGSEFSDFYVTLVQSGTSYETIVTVTQGEGLYTIPWSEFGAIDVSTTVSQIKLHKKNSASVDIYIDQIGFYGVPIIDSIEDFENGFDNLGWEATNNAKLEQSNDNAYDGSIYSAHISYDGAYGFSGFKTSSKKPIEIVSTDDGIAFYAYNAGEQIDDFYVRLVNQYTVSYEVKITLKTGSAVYKIPYNDFKHMENAEKSFNVGDTITQFEIVMKTATIDCYFDSIGFYKYTLPVLELPTNCTVIDDFEVGMTGSGTIGWKAFGAAGAEISREYSSDKDGGKRSLKVSIAGTSWSGARANPSEYVYNNDSIAFELYVPATINTSNFVFKIALNGVTSVYYEKNIAADLEVGENLIIIPFDELVSTSDKATKLSEIVQPTDKISNIEFTAAANGAIYYVDNIVIYESVCSTQTMPYTYSVIEDFNRESAVPQEVLNATVESSTKHRYGNMGNSAHAYWEINTAVGDNRWSGIKYKLTSQNTVKSSGAGIVFWAYNNGEKSTSFAVKVLCGDNKYYEVIMPLDKGEGVYTIPYSRFAYESDPNVKLPQDAAITQIEFLSCDEDSVDYYVDEISTYYMNPTDVNFDSNIDDNDISLARYILLGLEPEYTGLSDTNEDGLINICDLVKIDDYISNPDDTGSSDATVVADYIWHPGLIDRDVSYDLTIKVNGETTTTAKLSCDNQDVTIDGYKVTIPYCVRASGNDLLLTVDDASGNYLGTIYIPCKSWTQSFGDEFALDNGSAFDTNKWGNSSSCSTTATDGVKYTEKDRAGISVNAYEIKDGKLVMKVTDEDCYSGTNKYNYSEFCINTKDSFRQEYGLFEANIATTGVEGVNTAFWLLPYGSVEEQFTCFKKDNPSIGLNEIDILETPVVNGSQVAQINEHYYDYLNENAHQSLDGTTNNHFVVDNIDQNHIYSCAWLESGIYYYIDNELIYYTTDVQPESEDGEKVVRRAYMIIDVSYQGPSSWLGTAPDNFDTLVANDNVNAEVDWVRAYK